jgi:exosortase/archaeosortase
MSKHITTSFFETSMQAFAKSLQNLLEQYDLTKKIMTYVKDEGANLNTMTIALKLIVNCEAWGVMEIFKGLTLDMPSLGLVNMQLLNK